MPIPVKLQAVFDHMNMVSDEMTAYINRKTGDLVTLTAEDISFAEDYDDSRFIPDWQRETIEEAKTVLSDHNFVELPDKFEIHEYRIMERFCYRVENERTQNNLLRTISGKRAFRRFKDTVYKEGIEKDWYRFREEAFKQIATEFLENEGIAFEDE